MFIKSTGFKKLINEAYKGGGLKIGNDGQGYHISGGYWVIWIMEGWLPKKELASIIELTGEMPEHGGSFRATKAGNQYELPWNEAYNAMGNALDCQEYMRITPLTLTYTNRYKARILQNPDNKTIVLINDIFTDMIDNTVVEYENGESAPEGPMISGTMEGVFWRNDTMALYVCTIKDRGNKKLLGYLEDFDITGEKTEDEH